MISPGCEICVARCLPITTTPRLITHFKSSNTNKLVRRTEAAAAEAHGAGREDSPHADEKSAHLAEGYLLRNSYVVEISESRVVPNAPSCNVQLANVARQQIAHNSIHQAEFWLKLPSNSNLVERK